MRKSRIRDAIRQNMKGIIIGLVALFLISLLFDVSLKTAIALPVLILAASFSTFYFNYVRAPVNFELVKLATVLSAVSFGVVPALAVGVSSTFFGKVLIGRIDEKLPISMLAISMVALAAAVFSSVNVTTLGITLVLTYNLAMFSISVAIGGDLAWNLPYEASNFVFNLLLFVKVAPLLLTALA